MSTECSRRGLRTFSETSNSLMIANVPNVRLLTVSRFLDNEPHAASLSRKTLLCHHAFSSPLCCGKVSTWRKSISTRGGEKKRKIKVKSWQKKNPEAFQMEMNPNTLFNGLISNYNTVVCMFCTRWHRWVQTDPRPPLLCFVFFKWFSSVATRR